MGFLKFLLIFFIVTYLLGIIGRLLLRRYVKKFQQHFEQQQSNFQNQHKQEGEITIQKNGNNEKIINKSEGDYIDYEEIK